MSGSLLISGGALLASVVAVVISCFALKETKRQVRLAVYPSLTASVKNDPPGRNVKHWMEITNGGRLARNIVCMWGLTSDPNQTAPASRVQDKISQLAPGCSRRFRETTQRLFLKWAEITCQDAEGRSHWSRYDNGTGQGWQFGLGNHGRLPSGKTGHVCEQDDGRGDVGTRDTNHV